MGTLHDRAVARAEAQLRTKLKSDTTLDHPAKHPAGFTVPMWITWAADYLAEVVIAYAEEILDPHADNPHERIDRLNQYKADVIAYLFCEYFYVHAVMWNTRAPEECHDDEFGHDIDENEFTFLLLTYGNSMDTTLAERLRDAITKFWEKRAAEVDNSGPRDRDTMPGALEQQPPPPSPKSETQARNSRQAIVLPILEKHGWSILDWANESDVDYHTVDDYLSGARNPYRSTRLKIARGLGIDVADLPS